MEIEANFVDSLAISLDTILGFGKKKIFFLLDFSRANCDEIIITR
jgi:hypothetical protein